MTERKTERVTTDRRTYERRPDRRDNWGGGGQKKEVVRTEERRTKEMRADAGKTGG
jgi:hypothetical protein